ncbi:hypothetical protein EIG84_02735, partial [Flavobacteriaceae bacterium 14752]
MKNKLFLVAFLCFMFNLTAQVNQIYTDYNGFWTSSSSSINALNPDNSHELLGFTFNGTTYSTGIDDVKLNNNSVTFTPLVFRALPIADLPISGGGSYFVGLGERLDGIPNGVDPSPSSPFNAITSVNQPPAFLTDGTQGLDLGTCLANIPSGTEARFNLSSAGIDVAQINGAPDILVSQIAQPSGGGDQLEFIDSAGNTVGSVLTINFTSEPVVANWDVDFYNFNSTQSNANFVNTTRPLRFFAADLSDFGITSTNAGNVVALLYRPSGSSDPAFLAFNEPAFGIATQLSIVNPNPPTQQNCDGTLTPGFFDVQLQDQAGNPVQQAGLQITASLASGPGSLLGTTSQLTNASGIATFNDLEFDVGGNHIIRFSYAGLDDALSSVIVDATGCNLVQWTGTTSSDWSDITNWSPQQVPDGNNEVIIPNGAPNYPVLDQDAGVGDLTMGSGASIDLNGFLLALNGSLTNVSTGATIDASAPGSELFMSAPTAQSLPANFVSTGVSNFTVENPGGVTLNSVMNISEVLDVRGGNLATNDFVTLVCSFTPRQVGQIDNLVGTISGDVTVEQCFPARRAFRLVSSSVTTSNPIRANWQEGATAYNDNTVPDNLGTHITGVEPGSANATTSQDGNNGFDYNPSGNASLFGFDNANQAWTMVANTDVNTLNAGEPYRLMIRGARKDATLGLLDITTNSATPTDTKLRSTGTVLKGPVNSNFPSTPAATPSNQVALMLGNPFQAIVDMETVLNTSTNLNQSFVVWDPTLGGTPTPGVDGGRGAFVTVNVTNNTNNNASSAMNKFLQPYQAAFVLATGATPALTFEEVDKAVNQSPLDVFSSQTSAHYINMRLFDQISYSNNDTSDDGLVIYFSQNTSNTVDADDAPKFFNIDENLARQEGNNLMSIENRAMPQIDEILELYTSQYRVSDYVLELEIGDFPNNEVYLFDNYTDTEVVLNENAINTYSFSVDQSIAESVATDRFDIRF